MLLNLCRCLLLVSNAAKVVDSAVTTKSFLVEFLLGAVQRFLSAGYAELIEHLVYTADAQAVFVGAEVAGGHAGQEDFLVVVTGEDFGFFGYGAWVAVHGSVRVWAESLCRSLSASGSLI